MTHPDPVAPATRPDASILEVLAERARRSSDTRLTADAVAGLLAAVALLAWRGPAWYFLLAAALCFCAFGVWGISDRELLERGKSGTAAPAALRVTRVAAGIVGIGAALFLIMIVLAKLLGTIIS